MDDITKVPLGIRLNNPFNIRYVANSGWQGLDHEAVNISFETFRTPVWGIRAAAVLMINHFDKRQADTIEKLVTIWAPPSENNTAHYIQRVADYSGFDPKQTLNLHHYEHLAPVMLGMMEEEIGSDPYTKEQFDSGLARAGVLPAEDKPLSKTGAIQGAQVSGAGVAGTTAVSVVQDQLASAGTALQGLIPYLDAAKYAFLAVTLAGLAYMVWQRIQQRRQGIA
jgi:hypothetical protein